MVVPQGTRSCHRGNIGTLDDLAVRVIPDCPFGVASGLDLAYLFGWINLYFSLLLKQLKGLIGHPPGLAIKSRFLFT